MLIFWFYFYRWLGQQTRHPILRDAVFISLALGSPLYARLLRGLQADYDGGGIVADLLSGRTRRPVHAR